MFGETTTTFATPTKGRNVMPENDWRDEALCAQTDPDAFLPEKGGAALMAQAIAICNTCPVRQACLDYAVANNEIGIWGATTNAQRAKIRNGNQTQEQIRARIKRAHENGTPALELAAIYGVSVRTVQRWVYGKKEVAA